MVAKREERRSGRDRRAVSPVKRVLPGVALVAALLAVLAGVCVGYSAGFGSGVSATQSKYAAVRRQTALAVSILGGGAHMWSSLLPLLTPSLAASRSFKAQILAWQAHDKAVDYKALQSGVYSAVFFLSPGSAVSQSVWLYDEQTGPKYGAVSFFRMQVLLLHFQLSGGRWLLSGIQTQSYANLAPLPPTEPGFLK